MNPDYMKGWRRGREDARRGIPRPTEGGSNHTYWLGYFDGYDEGKESRHESAVA